MRRSLRLSAAGRLAGALLSLASLSLGSAEPFGAWKRAAIGSPEPCGGQIGPRSGTPEPIGGV